MLDNRDNVEDVIWTNRNFVLVVEVVVSQSQLVWTQELKSAFPL